MRLLDKYILKAFVGPFLFGVFAFTSIFIGDRYIIPHCSIYNRIWCSATTRYESILF